MEELDDDDEEELEDEEEELDDELEEELDDDEDEDESLFPFVLASAAYLTCEEIFLVTVLIAYISLP